MFEKTKINEKDAGVGLFFNYFVILSNVKVFINHLGNHGRYLMRGNYQPFTRYY